MKRPKYGNRKVELHGIAFDSKGESLRYLELAMLQKSGAIMKLERQVEYVLAPGAVVNGKKKQPLKYRADFVYIEAATGQKIVEDFKGYVTPEFKIKMHLMKTVHGIDIRVTKKSKR